MAPVTNKHGSIPRGRTTNPISMHVEVIDVCHSKRTPKSLIVHGYDNGRRITINVNATRVLYFGIDLKLNNREALLEIRKWISVFLYKHRNATKMHNGYTSLVDPHAQTRAFTMQRNQERKVDWYLPEFTVNTQGAFTSTFIKVHVSLDYPEIVYDNEHPKIWCIAGFESSPAQNFLARFPCSPSHSWKISKHTCDDNGAIVVNEEDIHLHRLTKPMDISICTVDINHMNIGGKIVASSATIIVGKVCTIFVNKAVSECTHTTSMEEHTTTVGDLKVSIK